jgi:uncharacterized membrane protein
MMSRIDFMNELESLLSDIPIEERKEALQYYNDYFEDAGADHEEEIIKELVSPQRVASIIKADLNTNTSDSGNRGYFTEKGYQDTLYEEEKFELVGAAAKKSENQGNSENAGNTGNSQGQANAGAYQNNQQGNGAPYGQQGRTKNNTGTIIILAILSFPIWLPLLCAVFGVAIGILGAVFGIVLGFGAAGVAMIIAGIALIVAGLIQLGVPLVGLLLCGCGLIVLGLGMLFAIATAAFCRKVLPALVRGFVNLCRLPFKNRSVTA